MEPRWSLRSQLFSAPLPQVLGHRLSATPCLTTTITKSQQENCANVARETDDVIPSSKRGSKVARNLHVISKLSVSGRLPAGTVQGSGSQTLSQPQLSTHYSIPFLEWPGPLEQSCLNLLLTHWKWKKADELDHKRQVFPRALIQPRVIHCKRKS